MAEESFNKLAAAGMEWAAVGGLKSEADRRRYQNDLQPRKQRMNIKGVLEISSPSTSRMTTTTTLLAKGLDSKTGNGKEKSNSNSNSAILGKPPRYGRRGSSSRRKKKSDTDSEEFDISGSDGDDSSWISWFCNLRGNKFFCEVDEDYIQDDFNLYGLSSQVPFYDHALDLMLDVEYGEVLTEEQNELVESAAELLYGLVHARYILTSKGMAAMLEKYKSIDFGRCLRVYCSGQPCLPVGQSDILQSSTIKVYCPRCEDIYYPRSKYQGNIDGAFFGTTFPHLFLMTYPHLKPQSAAQNYDPRVFGFKIHKT